MENSKFFIEEIVTLSNGSVASSITNKATLNEARSTMHQVLASSLINPEVVAAYSEVKDNFGNVIDKSSYIAQ